MLVGHLVRQCQTRRVTGAQLSGCKGPALVWASSKTETDLKQGREGPDAVI